MRAPAPGETNCPNTFTTARISFTRSTGWKAASRLAWPPIWSCQGAEIWKQGGAIDPLTPEGKDVARRTLEKVQAAKDELDRNCQIRYKSWILNPWRYYPKKLE